MLFVDYNCKKNIAINKNVQKLYVWIKYTIIWLYNIKIVFD